MKTFTHPNKWVLSGALALALGFNVQYAPSKKTTVQSMDFSSTLETDGVVHGKIFTPKGVVPVRYVDNGENTVLAIIPKQMTEGKACDNCGYESITLDVRNKRDIDALNVALLQTLQRQGVPQSETVAVQAETEAPSNPLDSVLRACARFKDRGAKMTCLSERFITVIKRKNTTVSPQEAMDFYRTHIESAIRAELTDARRIANKVRRESMTGSMWSMNESQDLKNPAEMREEALKALRTIISGMPAAYEDVRKRVIASEVLFATEEAKELEQTFKQARESKDPSQGVYLYKEGELRRQDLQALLQDMSFHTNAALTRAEGSDYITRDLQTQYERFFADFTMKMQTGMWTKPYDFLTENVSPLPNVPNLEARQNNPGRGTAPNGVATPQRGDAGRGVIRSLNTTPVGPATTTTPSQTDAIIDATKTSDAGVSFGTPRQASPESIQQRNTIRGRQ